MWASVLGAAPVYPVYLNFHVPLGHDAAGKVARDQALPIMLGIRFRARRTGYGQNANDRRRVRGSVHTHQTCQAERTMLLFHPLFSQLS